MRFKKFAEIYDAVASQVPVEEGWKDIAVLVKAHQDRRDAARQAEVERSKAYRPRQVVRPSGTIPPRGPANAETRGYARGPEVTPRPGSRLSPRRPEEGDEEAPARR